MNGIFTVERPAKTDVGLKHNFSGKLVWTTNLIDKLRVLELTEKSKRKLLNTQQK